MSGVPALYETLIERDLDSIEPAVRAYRESASSHELFLAIARFAVLSYAPSQHAKHALLATLSAYELREEFGDRYDDVLIECARYAAASRQPWSEPPITDPPPVDESEPGGVDELRAAVAGRDRLRGERWLARRLDDPRDDLVAVAAEDVSDLGHKLIVTNAALKLVPILGEKGRFATLRVAVWEITAYEGEKARAGEADAAALLDRLIARTLDVESAHGVFLFDAALECGVLNRIAGSLEESGARTSLPPPVRRSADDDWRVPDVYPLARDLGSLLKAHAVAKRLGPKFPRARFDGFIAALRHNLEHGPSLEEWSFA